MNFYKQLFIVFVLSLSCIVAKAQDPLYMAPRVADAMKNGTRSADGNQGENYWANQPSYFLDIDFDPISSMLNGKGTIQYVNNSPDTLHKMTIALLGNIYREHFMRDWMISLDAAHEGTVVTKLEVNGDNIDIKSDKIRVSGTNMFVTLDNPLLPHSTSELKIDWHVLFPLGATIRSGNFGDSTFFISYFYPKIAVYDDIDGWDNSNYTGYTEFYGEFSNFEVNVTLPGDFFMWSTGELQNPKKVYTKDVLKKWKKAQKSDKVISIIGRDEVGDPSTYISMEPKTWTFKASNVTDFAFGCSNGFLWDSRSVIVDKSTGRRTTVNAAYLPSSQDYIEVADIAAGALSNFSNKIPGIPYPYPVMSVFNGHSGMEFPMMCNDASQKKRISTVGLTYHEIAHTYFPFYIGINERKYAWMDEGWASFFPAFYFDNYDYSFKEYFESRKKSYLNYAGDEGEAPIIMSSKAIRGRTSYRQAAYNKSFLAYYYLMEYLGKEKFTTSLQGYMNRWKEKHPIPQDFFNSINYFSGENLNWFWESWFLDKNHADLSIGAIDKNGINIINVGRLFLPIELEITYNDGSTKVINKPLSVWKENPYTYHITVSKTSEIESIKLGNWNIVDVDESNNYKENN